MEDLYAEAHRLYRYDPETGILSFKTDKGSRGKAESPVGSDNCQKYLKTRFNGRAVFVHRIIWLMMTGNFPAEHIDHINGITLDNRWNNLRSATRFQNQANRQIGKNNKTGMKGVHFSHSKGKYVARISSNGIRITLGAFWTIEEAQAARQAAAHLHGEFWREK